jgi:hypothetical protein
MSGINLQAPWISGLGDDLLRLVTTMPLALAGPGASEPLCERLGARYLDGDLVAAAEEVAAPTP